MCVCVCECVPSTVMYVHMCACLVQSVKRSQISSLLVLLVLRQRRSYKRKTVFMLESEEETYRTRVESERECNQKANRRVNETRHLNAEPIAKSWLDESE